METQANKKVLLPNLHLYGQQQWFGRPQSFFEAVIVLASKNNDLS